MNMEEMPNKNLGMQSPYYSNNPQPAMRPMPQPQPMVQAMVQPVKQPENNVSPMMMTFPEIYYKLQPYIMMVCDHLVATNTTMPSQDMLDNICDGIYDDVCKRDPNLAAYLRAQENANADPPAVPVARFGDPPPFGPFGPFGFGFRRRGLPRDLIEILLLNELFNRRRRYF